MKRLFWGSMWTPWFATGPLSGVQTRTSATELPVARAFVGGLLKSNFGKETGGQYSYQLVTDDGATVQKAQGSPISRVRFLPKGASHAAP